jgi:hypothetical protein
MGITSPAIIRPYFPPGCRLSGLGAASRVLLLDRFGNHPPHPLADDNHRHTAQTTREFGSAFEFFCPVSACLIASFLREECDKSGSPLEFCWCRPRLERLSPAKRRSLAAIEHRLFDDYDMSSCRCVCRPSPPGGRFAAHRRLPHPGRRSRPGRFVRSADGLLIRLKPPFLRFTLCDRSGGCCVNGDGDSRNGLCECGLMI